MLVLNDGATVHTQILHMLQSLSSHVAAVTAQICILTGITAALRDRILSSMRIITDVYAQIVSILQILKSVSSITAAVQILILVNMIADGYA